MIFFKMIVEYSNKNLDLSGRDCAATFSNTNYDNVNSNDSDSSELIRAIKIIENQGTLSTKNLTAKKVFYELWGGKICVTVENFWYGCRIDLSHGTLNELCSMIHRLGLEGTF